MCAMWIATAPGAAYKDPRLPTIIDERNGTRVQEIFDFYVEKASKLQDD
jgi:hypothetical protein